MNRLFNKEEDEMSELKPCPFCGEDSTLTYSLLPNHKHWYITCDCCGMMYQSPTSQRKYVKLSWNTRPIEDALNARIAELEGLVDQLIEAGELLAEYCDYETGKTAWDALVKDWKEREE